MADTLTPPLPQQAGERPPTLDEQQLEIKRMQAEANLRKANAELKQADTDEKRDKAEAKRRQAMQEWRESAGGMAYEYGLGYGAPLGAALLGHGAGHLQSGVIDKFAQNRAQALNEVAGPARDIPLSDVTGGDPSARARASGAVEAARPNMPKTGLRAVPGAMARAGSYFLPAAGLAAEGLALREAAEPSDEETFRPRGDIQEAAGTSLIGAGAGVGIEGGRRALFGTTPKGMAGDTATIRGLESALGPQDRPTPDTPPRQRGQTPAGDTPTATQPRTHSERLKAAVRSADGPNVRTKAEAQDWLEKNLDEGKRAAIGRELGVAPGRNFTQRIKGAIKSMASRPGLWAPLGAGALAYDAARSDARAGGEEVDATTGAGQAAAAAGGTAGGMYGLGKAGEMIARHAPTAARIGGRLAAPLGAGMAAYDAYNAVQGADIEPGPKYPTTSDIRGAHRRQMPRAPMGIGP